MRKRKATSCQPVVTKACGINSSAETTSAPIITRQCPLRSAIRPSRDADRMLPSAAADMAMPDTMVTREASTSCPT